LCTRSDGSEQLLVEVAEVRRHAENMRERAREAEDDARLNLRSAEEQEQASRFRAELREREAQMAYRDLRARLSHLLEVESPAIQGQMSKDARESFHLLCSKLEAACTDSDLNILWDVFIKSLSKGDIVYVPRYRERMRVVKMDRKRGRAKLQHGQLEIEVPIPELSWVEPPPGADPPSF
jgi:dsDNA-specific endonuclease/ATPase MutS2